MNYPLPNENPNCQCAGNPMAAFFCQYGHMLECHYPYGCRTAACSHLRRYDFSEEEVLEFEEKAKAASAAGGLKPYVFDAAGNATVEQGDGHEPTS